MLAILAILPAASWGEQATLEVKLTAAEGDRVETERYVAVLAQNTLWTNPLREVVAKPEMALPAWSLPPGRYMIFCSADGFAYRLVPPFDLAAGDRRQIACSLPSLARVEGRLVTAEDDSPVAPGRVTATWLLDPDRLYRVSPLGEQHLARNFASFGHEDGSFSVGLMPGERADLWVEADGRVGQRVVGNEVLRASQSSAIGPIRLALGGTLELTFTASAEQAVGSLLDLRRLPPSSAVQQGEVPRGVWLRPLPRNGEVVAWRSLAPGSYQVWLRSTTRAYESGRPAIVGSYEIRSGLSTRVAIDLSPPSAETEADVVFQLPPGQPAAGLTVWQWHAGRLEQARTARVLDSRRLIVGRGCRPLDVTLLVGPHTISAPYMLPPTACRASAEPFVLHAELSLAGELGGRLVTPFGFQLPSTAALRLDRCAGGAEDDPSPRGTYPATVTSDGSWKALVPAGCANLSLRIPGFAPVVWDGLEVPAKAARQLDRRRLEPGGSLLVRVVSADDGRGVDGARVDLLEESTLSAAVRASLDSKPVVSLATQWTDEQGFVQFESLPGGTFALRAMDVEGVRLGFSQSFQVAPAQETVLPDLELKSLGSLVIQARGEGGAALKQERIVVRGLVDVSSCGWELGFDASLTAEGGWTAEVAGLLPGTWRLVPELTPTDGTGTRVELSPVELQIGSGERREVELEIAGAAFEGVVTLSDTPIAADLRFRVPGKGSYTARSTSDENGRFSVTLPEPGRYDIVVLRGGPATTVAGVDLLDPGELVRVELPAGAIAGVVVDSEGRPVRDARVAAVKGSGLDGEDGTSRLDAAAVTDAEGRFRLEGLVAGRWGIRAWQREDRSSPRHVEVPSDSEVAGVRLVVGPGTTFKGRLLVGGAPVAAATGSALAASVPLDAPGGLRSFRTGADGTFALDLGPGAEGLVYIAVTDPRLPVAAFLVSAPGESDLEVDLVGGRAVLVGMGEAWESVPHHRLVLVNGRGAHVQLDSVPGLQVSEAGAGGAPRVVVPSLAPGVWSLVPIMTAADAQALIGGRGGSLAPLAVFEVLAGSTTEVDLSSDDG